MDLNRPSLRGLVPPAPFDSTSPLRDLELKRQWASQYWDIALQFANQVVSALQGRGFTVQILGETGSPGAGYVGLPQYAAILRQGSKAMDATIGNPVRFNSPAEEAQELAYLFGIYATDAQAPTGFNTSVLVPATSPPPPPPPTPSGSTANVSTQSHSTQTGPSYVRSASIIAPNGFQVGMPWTIVVSGQPNRQVSIAARKDGRDLGETSYGSTDSQGQFQMRGTFTEDTVGQWSETVKVGGETVGSLQFTVLPAPVSEAPSGSVQTPGLSNPAPGQTTVVPAGSPGPSGTQMTPQVLPTPWYQRIPPWGWAAIGLGALLLMRDRK